MKVIIYGSLGWIGTQFRDFLSKQNINYMIGTSRVEDIKSVKEEILRKNISHVISFIGRTHGKIDDKVYSTIDYLEQKGKLFDNIRDNLFSPLNLALLCKELNIHLGSGLGGQISRYWHDKDKTMYHTKKSLVNHLKGDSKMNYEERLINPL